MEVKKAIPRDHVKLTTIMRKSKSFWNYDQQQLDNWQAELTITPQFLLKNQVFKLLDKDKILALFAYSIQNQIIKLESLFVLPEYIGKGIGKLLMNTFLEKYKIYLLKKLF
jgi:GNAT superfamily N-acetyltransferase